MASREPDLGKKIYRGFFVFLLMAAVLSCSASCTTGRKTESETELNSLSGSMRLSEIERLLLESEHAPERQIELIRELEQSEDDVAVDILARSLEKKAVTQKWAVIRALGETGDRRALSPLVGMLDSRRHFYDAVAALETLGDPGAVDSLLARARGGHFQEQTRIAEALDRIGVVKVIGQIGRWVREMAFSDTFHRRKGKDNILYVPVGGVDVMWPFFRNYSSKKFAVLPCFGKSDMEKKKPTHVVIGYIKEKPLSEDQDAETAASDKIPALTFHCIPTGRGEGIELNWCGKTFSCRGGEKSCWQEVPRIE